MLFLYVFWNSNIDIFGHDFYYCICRDDGKPIGENLYKK